MTQRIFILKKTAQISGTNSNPAYPAIEITNIGNFTYSLNTPVSPLPLPEESHEENVLIKMEGNSAQITIDFKITPNSSCWGYVDDPQGNREFHVSNKTSPLAIINEIKDSFIPKSLVDGYAFEIQDDTNSSNNVFDYGTINNITFSSAADSPTVYNCSFTFMVGNVIGLYEANVPYTPNKVNLSIVAGNIVVSWEDSKIYASASDIPTVTGASIKYKKSDSPAWVEYGSNQFAVGNGGEDPNNQPASDSSTRLLTLSNLSSGTYRIKVAMLSKDSYNSNVYYYMQGKNTTTNGYEITK